MKNKILVLSFLSVLLIASSYPVLSAQCPVDSDHEMADAIAAGHAFDKHVVEDREYQRPIAGRAYTGPPVASHADFAHLLESIVSGNDPHRELAHDRAAYWDAATGTVVILNAHSPECGTAFRPNSGASYFEKLK